MPHPLTNIIYEEIRFVSISTQFTQGKNSIEDNFLKNFLTIGLVYLVWFYGTSSVVGYLIQNSFNLY